MDEDAAHAADTLEVPFLAPKAPKPVAVHGELRDLFALTAAFFVASVSWVAMKTTDTALLGHVGTRYLDATALSDLYTSSTGVFVQGRVLGVFVSQAVGAGNQRLAGVWLQTSYVVLAIVLVPVAAAWACTGPALGVLGTRGALRSDAQYYAVVLAACLPARIAFSQLSQFFSAQKIMRPSYVTAPIAMGLNLVFGFLFVIGIPTVFKGLGFHACPAVTAGVEYAQLAVLVYFFCHRQKLHAPCEPEHGWWSLAEVTRARLSTYTAMYAPAALAIASDFWRLAAIGAVAATLSPDDLGAFNASYRIMWMALTFTGSLGQAVSTKLGLRLGAGDFDGAKKGVVVGLAAAFTVCALIALVVAAIPRQLGSIFTSDEELLDVFSECRIPFATALFAMNAAVVCERVPMGMGRARAILWAGAAGSWLGQVPAVLLFVKFWRRDLFSVYCGVTVGYVLLTAILLAIIVTTDFKKQAVEAAARSEVAN